MNPHALKAFDTFDIIFMTGCGSTLPWSPHMQNILILLRMCMKFKKFSSVFMEGICLLVLRSCRH